MSAPDEAPDEATVARAISEIVRLVRERCTPLGIVVAGSIIRGEGDALSDLDVEIVHDGDWTQRVQRRCAGVPVELFFNTPASIRAYFVSEHEDGCASTADMFATGRVLDGAAPIVATLVAEAREWLARPLRALTEAELASQRYRAVDVLDDARGASDPAAARMLTARAVDAIVEHAFWRAGQRQPRRKRAIDALAQLDAEAARLVRAWADAGDAIEAAAALARHVLGTDTFFAWESARKPVAGGIRLPA